MRNEYEGLVDYISSHRQLLARQFLHEQDSCDCEADSRKRPADLLAKRLVEIGFARWRIDGDHSIPSSTKRVETDLSSLSDGVVSEIWQALAPEVRKQMETICGHSIQEAGKSAFSDAMLNSINAQVALLDEHGTILSANRAWLAFRQAVADAGLPLRGMVGENYLDVCSAYARSGCHEADDAVAGVQSVLARQTDKFQLQYQLCHPELCNEDPSSQASRWFMLSVTPVADSPTGAVVTHIEITAQVQAEMALRTERDRFHRMVSVAPGVIHSYTIRGDGSRSFVYASPTISEIYGFTAEQLRECGDLAHQAIHPDDRERVKAHIEHAKQTMSEWHCEYRVCHPTKGIIWVEGHSTPARESDGSLVWHGFLTDITSRMSTQEAMRRSEEHLRLAMGTASMGTWELDLETYELSWSDNLWAMMGQAWPSRPIKLEVFANFVHPDDRQRVLDEIAKAIESGMALRCEYRVMRPDGTMRWSLSHGRVVEDLQTSHKRRFVGVDLDITARKQLEEQFHQSQKMEAIGRLAGGVAHDFNNLLTVINGYCYVLLAGLPSDDEKRQHVIAIRDAGERAARLTGQLLAFSRKTIASPQVFDINALLTNFEELLSRLVGEDIILALDLSPDKLPLQADPAQIEQVIVNLAVNARDAMGTGGRLIIRTNLVTIDSADEGEHNGLLAPGNYVELSVTDTGCGMSSEIQAKIFDPFFTTKPVGKGTGLGLSVVHGVVTQTGGVVSVQSQLGVGTTFRILLPLIDSDRIGELDGPPMNSSRGNETVLLVEDEDSVRRIARVALESQGYRVLPASSGAEGIELFLAHEGEIKLLVSDLVMPGMSGGQLAQELRKLRSNLKVLFISGYTEELFIQQGVMTTMAAFLAKPFKPSTLARKVRTILDQATVEPASNG